MWWRALGVAAVLLCVGVAGGYAVADRSETVPRTSDLLSPVPARSPALPTPSVPSYLPDPPDPPLTTAGLEFENTKLRLFTDGPGVKVDVPAGWRSNQVENTNQWNFVDPDNSPGTYLLRITMVRGANVSIRAAMQGRIAALEDAVAQGNLSDLDVTSQTDDTLQATYNDHGHLRLTTERWVSFDGANAYASVAVTGREIDQAGLGDLLLRTITSMRELPAKPASTETPSPS